MSHGFFRRFGGLLAGALAFGALALPAEAAIVAPKSMPAALETTTVTPVAQHRGGRHGGGYYRHRGGGGYGHRPGWNNRHGGYYRHGGHRRHGHRHYRPYWGGGYWGPGWGGYWGPGVGYWGPGIGFAFTSPGYWDGDYYADPYYRAPYRGGWSGSHVAWCKQRYRTYDARTNTFVGRGYKRYQCRGPR
jgi:hypothetical protein